MLQLDCFRELPSAHLAHQLELQVSTTSSSGYRYSHRAQGSFHERGFP